MVQVVVCVLVRAYVYVCVMYLYARTYVASFACFVYVCMYVYVLNIPVVCKVVCKDVSECILYGKIWRVGDTA